MSAEGGYPLLKFDPNKTQIKGETVFPKELKASKRLFLKTAPDPQNTYSCMNGISAKGIEIATE